MKISFWTKGLYLAMVSMQLSGCSTMFGRQHDEEMVSFDSNIPDVEVLCSGKRTMTPGSIPLRQSKSHSCTAELAGYEKNIFRIRSGISWSGFGHSTALNSALWGWWTFGIGTGIGWLIDFPSGAMRNLKEDTIYIDMKPVGSTSLPEKVLDKTVDIGKALISAPQDLVRETTGAVLDTAIREPASQMGITDGRDQKEEKKAGGKVTKI